MQWEAVIGLETHAQLSTRSKIFSGAPTAFGAAPNTQACAVDLALPGTLPVLNEAAVEKAVRFGLAVGGTINRRSIFARKHYFYPDLPKNYQISQYELPIVQSGTVRIRAGEAERVVRLTRAHLEEDAGKSLHEDFSGMSGIDLNRAGTPLLEIVSEPDLRTSAEAVAYAKALHALVRWIDICDGNMQEGSFRCDANVSVRPQGERRLGTRCEIKNLNSFRFLERAIDYEVRRQIGVLEDGGAVIQETRLYDPERDETRSMRSKEDAMDYRYFPDPDLLPLEISEEWIEAIRRTLPERPEEKVQRYVERWGVPESTARALTSLREVAEFFERTLSDTNAYSPAQVRSRANWVTGALQAKLNEFGIEITQSKVAPEDVDRLQARVEDQTISSTLARDVFDAMWAGEGSADNIIAARGLKQISDSAALEQVVAQVLAAHPAQVAEYRAGRQKAFNFLVGQAMQATKGKANPARLADLLRERLR